MSKKDHEIDKLVGAAVTRANRAYMLHWFRRVSWDIVVDRLEREFKTLAHCATGRLHPLYVYRDDERRLIQLTFGWHPIGAKPNEIESGAALVVSQGMLGNVLVMLYPFESKNVSRSKSRLIWGHFNGPQDLHPLRVKRMMNDFLLYAAVTSAWMATAWIDQKRVEGFEQRSRRIESGLGWLGQPHAAVATLAAGSFATVLIYVAWIRLGDAGDILEPWAGLIALLTGWVAFYSSRVRAAVEKVQIKEEVDQAEKALRRKNARI